MIKKIIVITTLLILNNLTANPKSIRIVHITDIHIESLRIFSKDSIDNFKKFKNKIKEIKPDIVIASGDLVEFGEGILGEENYKELNNLIRKSNDIFYIDDQMTVPIFFSPGNHEYHTLVKITTTELNNYKKFIGSNYINYKIEFSNTTFIFLETGYDFYFSIPLYNSILPEPESSGLEDSQISLLTKILELSNSKYTIIITHHPFYNTENGQLEGIFLFNRKQFNDILHRYKINIVLSGHTHKNKVYFLSQKLTTQLNPHTIITNSNGTLFIQTPSLGKDGYYRVIEIEDDKIIIFPPNKLR